MPKRKAATEADNASNNSPANSNANSNSNSVAPVKRQRVSRACDQCRAAREKCDGIQPACFPCVSQNRQCTFSSPPKKRGVQTGYIKTLEVGLAWLFEKVPGCEEALENLLMHQGGQGQNLLVGNETDKAVRMHKRWRKSKVHKEIDRILSGGDVSQQRRDKSSPSGDESETEQSEKTSRAPEFSTPTPGSAQPAHGTAPRPSDQPEPFACEPKPIRLPPNHWRLLDIYFSYTHCWFPILEKQDLLKTVYLYPNDGLKISHADTSSAAHAEIWAALALTAYQDAASRNSTPAGDPTDTIYSPDEIYNIARGLVPSEEGPFEIQHARALLLLALINIGKGRKTCAWILVGLAHRIALDIGPDYQAVDDRSSRRATSVLMGCFILDTLISVRRRGAPSLETAGMCEAMSIPEDNLDEWQPWAPCEGFGQASSGLPTFSRSPAYSLTTFNQLYEVFKFLRKRLIERQDGVPQEYPQQIMLHLHQTIKPRLPFGNFIVSRNSSSATIPSAYVLRILFLWASALLDSPEGSPCVLILESIEQYLAQFGACGAPPFFATCLAMMSQHRSFGDLHHHSRSRWQALGTMLSSTWTPVPGISPDSVRPPSTASKTPGASELSTVSSMQPPSAMSIPTPSQADYYAVGTLHTSGLPHKPTSYTSTNPPFLTGAYPQSKQLLSPAMTSSTATNSMDMLESSVIMHGGPDAPMGHPGMGHHRGESFNGGTLDYDALLDDLASIDYIDRVDTDPQFMANLGYAPGCDITEVLSREFGAI